MNYFDRPSATYSILGRRCQTALPYAAPTRFLRRRRRRRRQRRARESTPNTRFRFYYYYYYNYYYNTLPATTTRRRRRREYETDGRSSSDGGGRALPDDFSSRKCRQTVIVSVARRLTPSLALSRHLRPWSTVGEAVWPTIFFPRTNPRTHYYTRVRFTTTSENR